MAGVSHQMYTRRRIRDEFRRSRGTSRLRLTLQALEDTNTIGSSLLLLFATPPCMHLAEPLATVVPHLRTEAVPGALFPQSLSLSLLEDFLGGTRPQIRHVLLFDQRTPYARKRADGMQETEGGEVGVVWWVVEGGHEGRPMEEAGGMGMGDEESLDEVTKKVGCRKTWWPIVVHEARCTNIP